MNNKTFVRKMTMPLGFKLGRIPKLKRFFFTKKTTKPLYIEFIGASGVGKSTLYKKLNKGFTKNWIDIRHFEELNSDKKKNLIETLPLFYNEIAKSRFINLSKENDSYIEKLNAFRTGYNILTQDGLLHLLNKEDLVMSDEGLLQFYSDGIIKLYESDKKTLLNLFKNRAVIYCYAPIEVVVERILKRKKKTGHMWYKHKGLSSVDLTKMVQMNNDKIQFLVSLLENDVPILKVDTTQDYSINEKQILSFINMCL